MLNVSFESFLRDNRNPHPVAKKWGEVFREMVVHTRGIHPGELLESRRPNEDEAVKDYRIQVFQGVTQKGINKAMDQSSRAFSGASYSIRIPNDDLHNYLWSRNFDGQNFESFMFNDVFTRGIEDPNGFLLWMPELRPDQPENEPLKVVPKLIYSETVWYHDKDTFIFLSDEVVEVTNYNRMSDTGQVYYVVTDTDIYRYEQYGKRTDRRFRLSDTGNYTHNLGELPVLKLGGIKTDDADPLSFNPSFLKSFFAAYLPSANDAVRLYSDWQAVMVNNAYPIREELSDDCSDCNGLGYDREKGIDSSCNTCGGTAKVRIKSPFGVYLRRPVTNITDVPQPDIPMVRFIKPETDSIEYMERAWRGLVQDAESALHQQLIDEAQSGAAKKIDREGQYSLMLRISDNMFDNLIYPSIRIIAGMRDINNIGYEPEISKPVSLSLRSEEDLTAELARVKESGAPDVYQRAIINDLISKRFGADEMALRRVRVSEAIDPLFLLSNQDKIELNASGLIPKPQLLASIYTNAAINEALIENEQLIYDDLLAFTALCKEKLNALVVASMAVQQPIVTPFGG